LTTFAPVKVALPDQFFACASLRPISTRMATGGAFSVDLLAQSRSRSFPAGFCWPMAAMATMIPNAATMRVRRRFMAVGPLVRGASSVAG
jgi:hypothetical protein